VGHYGRIVSRAVNSGLGRLGYAIQRTGDGVPLDIDSDTRRIIQFVRAYTGTSPERIAALCDAVRYVERYSIGGAILECGVWRGGSMMAVARVLQMMGPVSRDLYLFDTFEGMTSPTDVDRDMEGVLASEFLTETETVRLAASVDAVEHNMRRTGYPSELMHFVKGPVEDTVPASAPEKIALLRLDTDWYESTRHELIHLLPRVVENGVLIIDDYGHWQGARKAVDEYLETAERPILLHRIDYTGRSAIIHSHPNLRASVTEEHR
jgi:hypothetical protein